MMTGRTFVAKERARTSEFAFFALAGILLLALAVRLWGIDLRSITHPEVYIPGIPLPEGISEPPPRHDLAFALWWHFHDEPHPMGWYLAMMGWTELFGTSHTALRLPGAVLGAAAVWLAALIGRRVWGTQVGLLAALLVALHGFLVFWSQNARMYSAGMFLGLLCTLLLLRLVTEDRPRPGLELAYVLTAVAGVQTAELFWPVLALQVAWVALVSPATVRRRGGPASWLSQAGTPRLLQVQSIALMLAAPALTHSIYRGRPGAASDPSALFLADYAGFGFLFSPDDFAVPELSVPLPATLALMALGIALAVTGLSARSRPLVPASPATADLPRWLPVAVALGSAALMLWLGVIAYRRRLPLALLSLLPLLALALPALAAAGRSLVAAAAPALDRRLSRLAPAPLLFVLYAGVAPLVLFAVSFQVSVLAPRAFTIFVPYLLLLSAAGVIALAKRRSVGLLLGAGIVALFVVSIPYSWEKPGSPRDYQGLAAEMRTMMRPGDLVLVRERNWADTPLFYYLPDADYVARDWTAALAGAPEARVWLITWPPVPAEARREALAGYERIARIRKLRAKADLFVRTAP